MSKQIPPKPALLIAQLQMMSAALTKYAETYVPVSPSKADIESCVADLTAALQTQVQMAGAAEKATKDLYAVRDRSIDLLRRMRDAVYAYFGKSDPRIVEFGLDTLKSRRSAKNGNGSEESTNNPG